MTCACGATIAEDAAIAGVTMCVVCTVAALRGQPSLFGPPPAPPIPINLGMCEWCGKALATRRLIGTACCDSCTTRPARLGAARERWEEGRSR